MQKCCIRKSKVSSQRCRTRLMGDACFNDIVDKTIKISIKHSLVILCHIGFHRNTANCLKIASSSKQTGDCSIMSIKFQLYCGQNMSSAKSIFVFFNAIWASIETLWIT